MALAAAFLAFWVFDLVSVESVRDAVEPLGAGAAPAYVALSALLGAAFVPGPLLATGAGVLFGAGGGTLVVILASTLSAVISLVVGRGAGADLSGPWARALADLSRRHGLAAVVVQRLAPGVPDTPASYLFGVAGVGIVQIALGTVIGSAPRALAYASIGSSLDDPVSPTGVLGAAILVVTGIAGLLLARRMLQAR